MKEKGKGHSGDTRERKKANVLGIILKYEQKINYK